MILLGWVLLGFVVNFVQCAPQIGISSYFIFAKCPDSCPDAYRPVCGGDWKTYKNRCLAKCADIGVLYPGPCENSRSLNGISYNFIFTKCPDSCPNAYRPVCGGDWKTYNNRCLAKCADIGVLYEGPCEYTPRSNGVSNYFIFTKCPDSCSDEYRPVCGGDWKTYKNRCLAKCADVGVLYPGVCDNY